MVLIFVVPLRPLQLRGVAALVSPMPPRLNGAQQPGTALRSHGHANQHAQQLASAFLRALNQTSGLKDFNLIPHNLRFLPLALVF